MAAYLRIKIDEATQVLLVQNVESVGDVVKATLAKIPVNGRNIVVEFVTD